MIGIVCRAIGGAQQPGLKLSVYQGLWRGKFIENSYLDLTNSIPLFWFGLISVHRGLLLLKPCKNAIKSLLIGLFPLEMRGHRAISR